MSVWISRATIVFAKCFPDVPHNFGRIEETREDICVYQGGFVLLSDSDREKAEAEYPYLSPGWKQAIARSVRGIDFSSVVVYTFDGGKQRHLTRDDVRPYRALTL